MHAPVVVSAGSEISGKSFFFYASILLLVSGIGSLISGAIVIAASNNLIIGSVYSGVLAIIAGCLGFCLANKCLFGTYITFVVFSLIVSSVGSSFQMFSYNFVTDMDACVSTSTSSSDSCANAAASLSHAGGISSNSFYSYYSNDNYYSNDDTIHFHCYGNSDDYLNAMKCLLEWVFDNLGDSIKGICFCATSSDCYEWNGISDCNAIFTAIPQGLLAGLVFDSVCFIVAFVILIRSCITCCCPTCIDGAEVEMVTVRPTASQERYSSKYSRPDY